MADPQLRPGAVIDDRFELSKRLGSGSTGVVWRAKDQADGRDVALKILHPRMSHDASLVAQLSREADVLQQLDHPNIARCHAFQPEGPFVYIAMELIDGRPLHEVIGEHTKQKTYLSHLKVTQIFQQICSAVGYAHSKYIVHRDLKPQNIMVVGTDQTLTVKVLDFGIARLLEGSIFDATTLGRQLGSLFYMSPEQTRGEAADTRSDVFALGTILFELLTMRRAWAWDNDDKPVPAFDGPVRYGEANAIAAVFTRLTEGRRPHVSEARMEIPPSFDAIVTRALAVERDDRYATVADLAKEALVALKKITGSLEAPTELARAVQWPDVSVTPGPRVETVVGDGERTALLDMATDPGLGEAQIGPITDNATASDSEAPGAPKAPEPPAERTIPETLEFQSDLQERLEDPGPTVRAVFSPPKPQAAIETTPTDSARTSGMSMGLIGGIGVALVAAVGLISAVAFGPSRDPIVEPIRTVTAPPPVTPPPPSKPKARYEALWSQLELVKANPADTPTRQKMRDGIITAANKLSDEAEAQSIVGCAKGNAMMMNARGMENCLLRLERAQAADNVSRRMAR